MTATRAPRPIPLSICAEDLLIAAAVLAALGDRRQHASLQQAADRLDPVRTSVLAATAPGRRSRG